MTRVLDRVSKINKPKPTVYLEVGMNGPEEFGNSFSSNYSWGALATMAGADVITKDVIKGKRLLLIQSLYLRKTLISS